MDQIIQVLEVQVLIYQYLELLRDTLEVEAVELLDHIEVLSPEELQLTAAVLVLLLMVLIFQHILAIMQRCPPAAVAVEVEVLTQQNQFIHKSYQRQVLVVEATVVPVSSSSHILHKTLILHETLHKYLKNYNGSHRRSKKMISGS
jgi:hypothetical protein